MYCLLSLRCGDRISKKGGLCVTGDNPIVGFSVRRYYCQPPRNSSLSFASFLSWLANFQLIVIVAGALSSERIVFFSSLLKIFAVASFPSSPSHHSLSNSSSGSSQSNRLATPSPLNLVQDVHGLHLCVEDVYGLLLLLLLLFLRLLILMARVSAANPADGHLPLHRLQINTLPPIQCSRATNLPATPLKLLYYPNHHEKPAQPLIPLMRLIKRGFMLCRRLCIRI